jgi:hypothetical protein
MSTNLTALKEAQAALDTTTGNTISVDRATLQALVGPPSQTTANELWRWLVPGLLLLTTISLVGMLYLIADGSEKTSPDLALTAFTALLTGLLGLFIKSPQTG